MSSGKLSIRWLVVLALLLLGACQDATGPIGPPDLGQAAQLPRPGQDVAAWFSRSADEVLALPLTVFADYDEVANRLVFGVQNTAATFGVQNVLARLGIPSSAYLIEVVQPIHFASSLRDRHRPTVGGLQIHWGPVPLHARLQRRSQRKPLIHNELVILHLTQSSDGAIIYVWNR